MCVVADQGEVSVFSLDEQLADYTVKEIGDFVSQASSYSISYFVLHVVYLFHILGYFPCIHEKEFEFSV